MTDRSIELQNARFREALEIIAGKRQCLDNLMSNTEVAVAALKDAGYPDTAVPVNFCWINRPVTVTGGDYRYQGTLLCSFPKGESGPVRYIVLDQNRRLFIHNAEQCSMVGHAPTTGDGK